MGLQEGGRLRQGLGRMRSIHMKMLMAVGLLVLPRPFPETRQKLYVTNSAGNDLHVVDVATNQVIKRIEVGPEPHGIAASADGTKIFLTIENAKGKQGELVWFDPVTDTVTRRMTIGPHPNQLACTPDGAFCYVPCEDGHYWVIDTEKAEVAKKVETGGRPHNTVCSADGKIMFLATMGAPHRVTLCDTRSHEVVGVIPFSDSVRPVTVSADGTRFYAHVDGLVGFEVADVASRKMISRVEADVPEDLRKKPSRSHGLALLPDAKELWMCDVHHDRTYVFDLTADRPRQVATIEMQGNVYWLCFSPDGKTCYVSELDRNQVAAIDTATRKILARIPVGKAPKRVLALRVPAGPVPGK
jgi:YVTN family beta-propeller protein